MAGAMRGILCFIVIFFFPCAAARADQCDALFDQAYTLSTDAHSAYERENYDSAARLYDEAASYYEQVAEMTDCRCPKIAGTARSNAAVDRSNARLAEYAVAQRQKHEQMVKENEEKIKKKQAEEDEKRQAETQKKTQPRDPALAALLGSARDGSALLSGSSEKRETDFR